MPASLPTATASPASAHPSLTALRTTLTHPTPTSLYLWRSQPQSRCSGSCLPAASSCNAQGRQGRGSWQAEGRHEEAHSCWHVHRCRRSRRQASAPLHLREVAPLAAAHAAVEQRKQALAGRGGGRTAGVGAVRTRPPVAQPNLTASCRQGACRLPHRVGTPPGAPPLTLWSPSTPQRQRPRCVAYSVACCVRTPESSTGLW